MALTPAQIGLLAGGSVLENLYSQSQSNKRLEGFEDRINELSTKLEDRYTSMFNISDMFAPGGQVYRQGMQTAVDTAFTPAQKGGETLQSKGVNLTSYGLGTATDIAQKGFTKSFMDNQTNLAQVGTSYGQLASNMLGDYVDLVSDFASAEFMSTDVSSPFADLLEIGIGSL